MKNILLIYPPFCTPACPPYSLTYLYAFLRDNLSVVKFNISVIDLNLFFHEQKFNKYRSLFQNVEIEKYDEISKEFKIETSKIYRENNKKIVNNKKPDLLNEILDEILKSKPDTVAFSVVYSSQMFYTKVLVEELKKKGIKTIVGGPAVNDLIHPDLILKNEIELLNAIDPNIKHDDVNCDTVLDFNIWNLDDYFISTPVIPIRTTSTCYYQKCVFCSHHNNGTYFETPLVNIKKSIIKSKQKYFFFTDDLISKKRLLDIAAIMPKGSKWMCQLKPTIDLDKETLVILQKSGLKNIIWGLESGSDRVLKLMKKGTNTVDIKQVLGDSHSVGIKNIVYIMFGFPSETADEFKETIDFLKENDKNIDLISTSIFGLQKGTHIYENYKDYGITKIIEQKRTVLEPKISYEVENGLSTKDVQKLRKKIQKTIEKINKFPKNMNFFREHMLLIE